MSVQLEPTLPTPVFYKTARARPLLVREGARFDCFGDGLCCTDIHALGPVTPAEKKAVDLIAPGSLVRNKDLKAPVFKIGDDRQCVNRSARGCELHAKYGMEAKPLGCSRFPFGLMSTPEGGRITTEHRCPCRTMGERPLLTVEAAEPWLLDPAKRLFANGRVSTRVALTAKHRISFERFRVLERHMISELVAGKDPISVFEAKPFSRLDGMRWSDVAKRCEAEDEKTSYGEAMIWFGRAIRAVRAGEKMKRADRPWESSFDKAEARSKTKARPETVIGDYLADLLWSLDWVFSIGRFEAGLREAATLHAIALEITNCLIRSRVRADRAAAEAITIVELSRQSNVWEEVQEALR